MKNLMRTFAVLFSVFVAAQVTNIASAANTGDASQVNMKLYKVWVSRHADCTDATLVYSENSPTVQNMINNPTLGTGSVSDGTYPCVVLKMSDLIIGKPSYTSDSGHCTPSTSISIDVFRADNGSGNSTCPDGTSVPGTGTNSAGIEDRPCLYMSTSGSDLNTGWVPTSPFPLSGALVVAGDRTGTFVADFRGKIEDAGGECGIQPPVFGFR
jgi:hypothetical protein